MHGCKEGQCASCKSFVLDGEDIELDRYSTFALPDFELEEGFTLLCRAHVYEDVTIELLNYDEEMIRSGLPDPGGGGRGGVQRAGHPRHAAPGAQAGRAAPRSRSGPGSTSTSPSRAPTTTRSFSMANTSSKESGQLEFVIKVYPDGLFSQLPGHRAGGRRPARPDRAVRRLHAARRPRLATWSSSAAAPGWRRSCRVLRSLAERGSTRKATYYYGARTQRDLCFEKELHALERDRCRTSATSRRCPRPTTTTPGTARSA